VTEEITRQNAGVWTDETDATQLSQRLRLGPRELITVLGGPWRVAWRIPDREAESPGTLFVGRVGPSVALLVTDAVDPVVTVGRAVGEWSGPTTLQWSLDQPVLTLTTPAAGAPAGEVDGFLARLGRAVDDVAEDVRGSLVLCRYCGDLVSPVHAMGDERCARCGSEIFGIVY